MPRIGYCETSCVLCSQVCPTGAIWEITPKEKGWSVDVSSAAAKPVRLGTAFYDRGRCLPWAMDTPCVVCQEVCPISPKAIFTREIEIVNRWGKNVKLVRPYVDPTLCNGCGICEHECPVKDYRAIRVTAVGETRSRDRSLLLK